MPIIKLNVTELEHLKTVIEKLGITLPQATEFLLKNYHLEKSCWTCVNWDDGNKCVECGAELNNFKRREQ